MAGPVTPETDRRAHQRARIAPGHVPLAVRLRTGASLKVLETSPEGLLIETPVRLLPGCHVHLVLQDGTGELIVRSLVAHSRVGCIRGAGELRYLVGLWLAAGMNYSGGGAILKAWERTTRTVESRWGETASSGW